MGECSFLPPYELHAAFRQMSLGKAAGEDEVTAELLKFGGSNLWEVVLRVCQEQRRLSTELLGLRWFGQTSGVLGWWSPCGNARGTRRTRILGEVLLLFCLSAQSF